MSRGQLGATDNELQPEYLKSPSQTWKQSTQSPLKRKKIDGVTKYYFTLDFSDEKIPDRFRENIREFQKNTLKKYNLPPQHKLSIETAGTRLTVTFKDLPSSFMTMEKGKFHLKMIQSKFDYHQLLTQKLNPKQITPIRPRPTTLQFVSLDNSRSTYGTLVSGATRDMEFFFSQLIKGLTTEYVNAQIQGHIFIPDRRRSSAPTTVKSSIVIFGLTRAHLSSKLPSNILFLDISTLVPEDASVPPNPHKRRCQQTKSAPIQSHSTDIYSPQPKKNQQPPPKKARYNPIQKNSPGAQNGALFGTNFTSIAKDYPAITDKHRSRKTGLNDSCLTEKEGYFHPKLGRLNRRVTSPDPGALAGTQEGNNSNHGVMQSSCAHETDDICSDDYKEKLFDFQNTGDGNSGLTSACPDKGAWPEINILSF